MGDVRPHGLRHAAVTEAFDRTRGNVRAVQRFSRHRDLSVLQACLPLPGPLQLIDPGQQPLLGLVLLGDARSEAPELLLGCGEAALGERVGDLVPGGMPPTRRPRLEDLCCDSHDALPHIPHAAGPPSGGAGGFRRYAVPAGADGATFIQIR